LNVNPDFDRESVLKSANSEKPIFRAEGIEVLSKNVLRGDGVIPKSILG